MKKYLPYAYILAAATCWGCIGLFTRYLTAAGLDAMSIVSLRNVGGMLLLSLFFGLLDRRVFRIQLRHLPIFLGSGLLSVLLFTWCYFSCQQLVSLAVSGVLLYTAPAFVVLLSAVLWKEKITSRKLVALLLTLLGCALVTGIGGGALVITPYGLLLGLGAGFFYATYSIFASMGLKHYRSETVTLWTFLVCGTGSLFVVDYSQLAQVGSQPRLLLLSLGLICIATVLPYLLYTRGLSQLEAGRASITASLEPVVAAFVGVVVFREKLTLLTVLGALCVLGGVFVLTVGQPAAAPVASKPLAEKCSQEKG